MVSVAVYLYFFGVQGFYTWQAHRVGQRQPYVRLKPVELSDSSISHSSGTTLAYFGYEFEVPWTDVDQQKTRALSDSKAIIVFSSGNVVSFWAGPPNGLISTLSSMGGFDSRSLAQVIGIESTQSDYALQRAILRTAPEDFSLFMPKNRAIQLKTLLMIKVLTASPVAESVVYSLHTREFEGFQYGRPLDSAKAFRAELFAADGHMDILFGQKRDGSTIISQADVNRVVQSVHRLAAHVTPAHSISLQNAQSR